MESSTSGQETSGEQIYPNSKGKTKATNLPCVQDPEYYIHEVLAVLYHLVHICPFYKRVYPINKGTTWRDDGIL